MLTHVGEGHVSGGSVLPPKLEGKGSSAPVCYWDPLYLPTWYDVERPDFAVTKTGLGVSFYRIHCASN